MAKAKEPFNPFYVLVAIVGVTFLITAFAYGTMAWRATQPVRQAAREHPAGREQHPLLVFLDRHGIELMTWELIALGGATAAAMGLDQRRSRLAALAGERPDRATDAESEQKIR